MNGDKEIVFWGEGKIQRSWGEGGEYQSVNGLFAVKVLVDVWGPNLFADVTVIQTDSREAANSLVARRLLISEHREAGERKLAHTRYL